MAAAGGHYQLQQQRPKCEAAIKNCINNDLKEICKAYNYQVSGTKAVLQKRCLEILDNVVNRGDQAGFNDLFYRVSNHGQAPPRSSAAATSSSSSNYHTNTNGAYHNATSMAPHRAPGRIDPTRYFKSSPFYEVQEAVLPVQDLPAGVEMPQNRNTIRVELKLTADQVSRLKADPSMRLLLYCGNHYQMSTYPRSPVDVAFPNQIEVKINGDEVRSNFKGLKNKPGSTKPADITSSVRKANGYPNQVAITYALTKQRFSFMVHLVKYISAETLTERIKTGRHGGGIISKQRVLDEMNRINADPDIAATSARMSLKDPISTLRINLPVRSAVCKHNQCFDGSMFIQLQEQAPQWSCPVCSKSVSYESLCVDKYFEEILQKTSSSIEKVDVEPNGEWRIIKEEDDTKPAGHSSRAGRAAYDDDFDDDFIEVVDPKVNGKLAAPRPTPSLLSPMPDQGFPMNTPPLSSRGVSLAPSAASATQSNKRPASAVIDLTLDDDDEPPRSGKRQQTGPGTQNGNSSQYSTPNSLPEHRYTQPQSAGQSRGTDSYRPSSNAPRSLTNVRTTSADYNNNRLSSGVASGPGSPYRPAGSISPGFPSHSTASNQQHAQQQHANWNNHSRPATGNASSAQGFQPFSIRQHGATSNSASQSPQQSYRLPPILSQPQQQHQQQQNGYSGGWRSDYQSYSNSPPGG
ncbi:hypothetical protein M409DRAFT_29680 [Zasmidium cellare ATCC 36951]|uniref:SP-RING-type domain-containing protein n=1 Tax=Zasmidium cellare ATCC 36951 TaxID=1080233 RepID=A0A6A6C124_ZASCE|nr:uncharacterized protein M409DRAFT_29680 [Zasmidium cellare ATCC 36951]KAF2159870.1 hypothetical protein M409DRAFT_29680 [Zasmidium cellare ATCC 36951]